MITLWETWATEYLMCSPHLCEPVKIFRKYRIQYKQKLNEPITFYVENFFNVKKKNHGTVVYSTIHCINGYEYNHIFHVQHGTDLETLFTKNYLHTRYNNKNKKRATQKLQNMQPKNDLSSQKFRQPETNPKIQIHDEKFNNTFANFG